MHGSGLGHGNKMGHVNLFGAHPRAGPGRVATAEPFVAVENLQTLLLVILARVHQADNRRQHRIGAQKPAMTADTGTRAAKAVYTASRLDIFLEMIRRYVMGFAFRGGQRIDDIGLYPIEFFIGLFDVYGQVPHDGGHLDGVNGKGRCIEIQHCGFNEQFAGQQGFSVDAHGTGSALAVLTGRVPGQGGVFRVIDLSEKIDETLNAAGFDAISPAAGNLCPGVEAMDF